MDLVYTLPLTVRYGEVGHDGVATLTSLANWLQEAAGQSANTLGFGEEAMAGYGLTWILTRLVLRIHRLPGSGEAIALRSWPSTQSRLAQRGYALHDAEGTLLVSGGSAWSIMDLSTRRMAAIPAHLAQTYPADPPPCDPFTCRALPRVAAVEARAAIRVRKDDVDLNRHVNNAHYLSWVLEALPHVPGRYSAPALIDLTFRSECFPGEELVSVCARREPDEGFAPEPDLAAPVLLAHAVRRGPSSPEENAALGEDVCRAVTLWPTDPLAP